MTLTVLRIAVVIEEARQPMWVAELLDQLTGADCVHLVRNCLLSGEKRDSRFFKAYERLDQMGVRWYDRVKQDYLEPNDLGSKYRTCRYNADELKQDDLDIVLDLRTAGSGALDAQLARYGIWTLEHGDNGYRGAPLLREIEAGRTTVVTRLVARTTAGRLTLLETVSAVNRDSLYRSRLPVFWKALQLPLRGLRRLTADPDTFFHERTPTRAAPAKQAPPNTAVLRAAGTSGFRLARNWIRNRIWRQQWFIAVRRGMEPHTNENDVASDSEAFQIIEPPPNETYADPFAIRRDGRDILYFEKMDLDLRKGVIACGVLGADGRISDVRTVIEADKHLSYPFLFGWKQALFMIPEYAEGHRIDLYQCVDFPYEWRFETTIMDDVYALDATLHHDGEDWWMFVNMASHRASALDELFLFHAKTPTGPWVPHRQNPVVSDVRSARPAGALFYRGGQLIRPSQDCSVRYGYAVNFNSISVLNPLEYREKCQGRLDPHLIPGALGIHINRLIDRKVGSAV